MARPSMRESTALGSALLAGHALGLFGWDVNKPETLSKVGRELTSKTDGTGEHGQCGYVRAANKREAAPKDDCGMGKGGSASVEVAHGRGGRRD